MKKVFTKFAIILTTSSLVMPLTACVYNFYINAATNAVVKSFANQTSSIVKSLVMSKEKQSDTSQTIQDMLNSFSNPSIRNETKNTKLTTWQDFINNWGYEKKINTKGFEPEKEKYFIANGEGSLTKQVNSYNDMNKIFSNLNYILGVSIADNRTIYGFFKNNDDVKNTITNLLNDAKKDNPTDTITKLLKNIVIGTDWKKPDKQSFTKNVVNPVTSMLDYLVNGQWSKTQITTPTNKEELKTFMDNWKDEDNQPYSQWNSGSSWDLSKDYYESWTPANYNFYRAGTLINYLFYKIGKDYQISQPNFKKNSEGNWIIDPDQPPNPYKDRYLGDILTDYLISIGIDQKNAEKLLLDLEQYLPHLLENPSYITMIIEAIIPILKQWGLGMSDISQGVKNLTFGNIYPSDDKKNSYNFLDILNNINYFLQNPIKLETVIKTLMGWADYQTTGSSFAYDIKIKVLFSTYSLGDVMKNNYWFMKDSTKQELVNSLMSFINTDSVKSAFNNVLNIYQKWIASYNQQKEGIDIDLTSLKDFLLKDKTGLLTIINEQIIPVLYEIFTDPEPLSEAQYFEFYKSIGGQVPPQPNEEPPVNFKENSFLWLIQNNISDTNNPLGQIVLIALGNSSETNKKGLLSFIADSNNQWIKDNYTNFFDIENKSISTITNLSMKTKINNGIISDILIYNLKYTLNNHIYYFLVKSRSHNSIDNFTGTKDFYFTDIELISGPK